MGTLTYLFLAMIAFLSASSSSSIQNGEKSRRILLTELEDFVKEMDERDGWVSEFNSLPDPQTQLQSWNYALMGENIAKHRYPPPEDNLLTYDDTRVRLSHIPGDTYSDFINANWVDGYIKENRNGYMEESRYIATQCPIDSTIPDFYRMIWEQNVHQVVMLASPHDLDKNKCSRYFPNATHSVAKWGEIEVKLWRTVEYPDVVVRLYALILNASKRILVHNHFVSWPDKGVPKDPNQLLNLIRLYRNSDSYTRAWPLLVHCSAGVGRTGTFLLTDAMYDMAEKEDYVDFLKHLWLIRNQRISLIEKPEQYALAHKVILQAYKDGEFDKTKSKPLFNPYTRSGTLSISKMTRSMFTLIFALLLYICNAS